MKTTILILFIAMLSLGNAFAHKVPDEQELRVKECTIAAVIGSALGKFEATVSFDSQYLSVYDVEGRIAMLTKQVQDNLSAESKIAKRLVGILGDMTPPDKWRTTTYGNYDKYKIIDVRDKVGTTTSRIQELIEDNCQN